MQVRAFDEMISNYEAPILVDFYASNAGSGPCKMMSKEVAKLSAVMGSRVKIVKIDTEANPSIARRFQIDALPTSILFQHGSPIGRFIGIIPAQQLKGMISAKLNRDCPALA